MDKLDLLLFHMISDLLVKNGQVGHVLFLLELGRVAFQNFSLGQRHGLYGVDVNETSLIDKQQMRPLVSNFIQRRPFVTFNIDLVA